MKADDRDEWKEFIKEAKLDDLHKIIKDSKKKFYLERRLF